MGLLPQPPNPTEFHLFITDEEDGLEEGEERVEEVVEEEVEEEVIIQEQGHSQAKGRICKQPKQCPVTAASTTGAAPDAIYRTTGGLNECVIQVCVFYTIKNT